MDKIAITDIETNNLYDLVSVFHCAWIYDPVNNFKKGYRPNQFEEYITDLEGYDLLVGHNVIDYDCAALKKLFPSFKSPPVFDTLVLSRMLEPDRPQGHSLRAWGESLGLSKGDYGEEEDAWDVFTEPMFTYCERDVDVTTVLYKHLCEKAGFDYLNPPHSELTF